MDTDKQDNFAKEVGFFQRQASRYENRTGKPYIGRHTLEDGEDGYAVALEVWKAAGIDAKTPMGEFRPWILRCLLELRVGASYEDVTTWIEKQVRHMLTPYDFTHVPSNKVRWKQAVSGEGTAMRKEGLIASGIWELTDKGIREAERLTDEK